MVFCGLSSLLTLGLIFCRWRSTCKCAVRLTSYISGTLSCTFFFPCRLHRLHPTISASSPIANPDKVSFSCWFRFSYLIDHVRHQSHFTCWAGSFRSPFGLFLYPFHLIQTTSSSSLLVSYSHSAPWSGCSILHHSTRSWKTRNR